VRTTLTIDDRIGEALKELARRQGKSFKQVVNEVLRRGLGSEVAESVAEYRVRSHSLGLRQDIDLTKATQLAAALETEEQARKLAMRK